MKIEFVDIQNFRKLKNCRIEFSEKETLFVGANNSGKTSAMSALILFFKDNNKFTTRDFTLSNWKDINSIGESWIKETDLNKIDFSLGNWENHLPTLDVWLNIKANEIHYVNHLIPTLDWTGGLIGVRLRYEPKDIKDLYNVFKTTFDNAKSVVDASRLKNKFDLWPKNMWDFLDKKINSYFTVNTYLLNPELKDKPQKLNSNSIALESDAFSGLIKVDIINAQRGFSDTNPEDVEFGNVKNLSSQLRRYYDKHLNPSENPTINDITALSAIHSAKKLFDENLQSSFKSALSELEFLNYPGFGNPKIKLSSKINTVESLNHDSSVQYNLDDKDPELSLPENYNGLGYQNLISIVFKLIRFRDEWMQVGKSYKQKTEISFDKDFEPLHFVLIEEPEAHLHAQVQQVFINQAYNVLRNHPNLKQNSKFTTQLVISTHSNHIAHEVNFSNLRYFKRQNGTDGQINTSTVINLSATFGPKDDTNLFAIRYLKTTHCDLFFADAVILVEGPVERILVPTFIKQHKNDGKSDLSNCYISILEIGGSHAHRLKPLIENLGLITLIITDLDSVSGKLKVQPEKLKGFKTGNDTLKTWIPQKSNLDELLNLNESDKEQMLFPIKVAFQIPLKFMDGNKDIDIYPYTFEDTLVMENRVFFASLPESPGLLGKMITAAKELDISKSAKDMYDVITKDGAKKAEFALELLCLDEPNKLQTPKYIKEGLDWLVSKLSTKKDGLSIIKNVKS